MQNELEREKQASKNNTMSKSQYNEDVAELSALKRKTESQKREIDLLRKQTNELKSQVEAHKNLRSERSSFHQETAKNSIESRSVTIKRDQNAQRELQLKDLEVII